MARSISAAIVVTSERRRLLADNANLSWEEVTAPLHRSEGHRHRSEDTRFD
ncbi:MAG: hypothetical protein K0S14_1443 [Thermomicrobiales bacterium]|jgi:hypothetical protein|nr:hypothetical protein [Thermomicrobiales bacterium]MCE3276480.1 hypothetical protein [Propionibacteriaceae bacterium]